jgi:vancomycin resistance protein YoaR
MAKKKLKIGKVIKKLYLHSKRKVLPILLSLLVIPAILLTYFLLFAGRIYPGVTVSGVNIGGLSKINAEILLRDTIKKPDNIVFSGDDIANIKNGFVIPSDSINLTYNYKGTVDKAYAIDRSPYFIENIYLELLTVVRLVSGHETNLPMSYLLDKEKLLKYLEDLSSEIYNDPIYPSIKVINGQIIVEKGRSGRELDTNVVLSIVLDNISWAKSNEVKIVTKNIDVELSPEMAQIVYERAQKLYSRKLIFKFEDQEFTYQKAVIVKFIKPGGGVNIDEILKTIDNITKEVERESQNPVFKFEDGVVKEFLPAKDGITVQKDNFGLLFTESISKLEDGELSEITAEIPVTKSPPPNKTEDVNNLGIKELLGNGISYFRGSIPSRVHNVGLAASKFNGILIAPGETLSFNKILGDVSKFTGFEQAYIIQDGKTILGDGGGVCQVSTTLFRAVLDAGLPVLERRAHAYRVSYYEQYSPPGIDATVFYPTTDFKFKNDTATHILIQTKFDPKALKLTFDLYGTSDGRVAEITKPIVSRPIPPPDDLYTDDPTLPTGQVKQIDWKAWGAKVSFDYKVTRGEETLFEKTFVSNYQPWQAKFLRGTGPAN